MKQLRVEDFNITFSDSLTEEQVKEAIDRGFAGVDFSDKDPIYLVKINVGNMSVEHVRKAVKGIREDFLAQGIKNCIFVPLHKNGIQDIEVIEVSHETV